MVDFEKQYDILKLENDSFKQNFSNISSFNSHLKLSPHYNKNMKNCHFSISYHYLSYYTRNYG